MCYTNHNVPKEFYSFEKKVPFDNCLVCNRSLLLGSIPYTIEKSYRSYPDFNAKDIIYEYAICYNCMMELSQEISSHSKASLRTYMDENASFLESSLFSSDEHVHIDSLLSHCVIKGKSILETNEYNIYGMFKGGDLYGPVMPYMICGEALSEISDGLSVETKEEFEFFFDEFFAGPPEVAEILKSKPLIF